MAGERDEYEDLDWGDYDEPDEFEEALQRCGSFRKGQCDLAGTEYCDFVCPFYDDVFRVRRPTPSDPQPSPEPREERR